MLAQVSRLAAFIALIGMCLSGTDESYSQEVLAAPARDVPTAPPGPAPSVPEGIEVQARGPVHEAFATPSGEAQPTQPIPKKPPAPLEEMPPEEKPDSAAVWIGGYYAWDDDRQDFLWVSGCWRVKPDGKEWVPGYWREVGAQWQWVPGFWALAHADQPVQISYNPTPPAPPQIAPPAAPPTPDNFFVPGYWMWLGDRYAWRAGYWTRVRPGYVYVASHYRWSPYGYVFVPGYWDLGVAQRGLLYAPVVVNPGVVGAGFVYTPAYAVTDTIMLDALFVRPASCHYYFGDYYGPRYVAFGFEPCIVYSRRHYEPIMVYERWHYRDDPRWADHQMSLYHERFAGRAPLPPRTLVQQRLNNSHNAQMLAPARTVMAARGQRGVALDHAARVQVRTTSMVHQQALATQRRELEPHSSAAAPPARPRIASMNAPTAGGSHPSATAARPASAPATPHSAPGANALHPNGSTHLMPQAQPTLRPGQPGYRAPAPQRASEERKKKG
jgi:hypothetical protein